MFVGTQQRITLDNIHYYVDEVFYNKILCAYVLIELKTTKLMAEAVGQLNMYLNYYAAEVMTVPIFPVFLIAKPYGILQRTVFYEDSKP